MTQAADTAIQDKRHKSQEQFDDEQQLVLFQLGGENYGVDIYSVQRLIQVPDITTVPRAPGFVEGVIDVRGDIIPVINLLKRFGIPDTNVSDDGRIVITEIGEQIVGLLVDAVSEVTRLPKEDIEAPSDVVRGVNSDFIAGIGKQQQGDTGRLIIVLDVEKVLSEDQEYLAEVSSDYSSETMAAADDGSSESDRIADIEESIEALQADADGSDEADE
ncbi:MAG: chemotaxis protein CheW [Armatimonadota bacterium]